MIRFIRDPQPPYTAFKAGMVRDLGSALETILKASGDAVDYVEPSNVFPAPAVLLPAGTAPSNPVRALSSNDVAATQALVSGGGYLKPTARANGVFDSYGVRAYDTCATNITIGVTALTHVLSNERPRFQTYTRKCTLSATPAEIRFASASFTASLADGAFSIDVYIEQMPTEWNAPNNPFIDFLLSNTTSLGANYSRWSFSAQYLRQGWNTLKVRRDDTTSSTAGAGNLPTGLSHPADVGTGFNWAGTGQFFALTFNNMSGFVVHVDELRRPAKAKPVVVLGFDASGYNATDEVFVTKVAPLLAQYGMRGYCTMTNIYELIFSGSQAWTRIANLHDNYGWDVINHTWSHGATEVGKIMAITTMNRVSNVVTVTTTAPHGIPLNKVVKASMTGASPSDMNGVFDITTTGLSTFTYTAAGTDGAGTGTRVAYTFLDQVFQTNTAENLRLLEHELGDINRVLRASGFFRSVPVAAFPNNSVPELSMLQTVCARNDINLGRAYRGGYTFLNEFGIDNPLNFGSVVMDSGTNFTRLSEIQAKVQGCIDRGEHLWIFGHFILDDTDPANSIYFPTAPDFPPSQGGNPNPPAVALSGFGGWWYYSQLRTLMQNTIGPAIASGQLTAMSPSEYAAYMGGISR